MLVKQTTYRFFDLAINSSGTATGFMGCSIKNNGATGSGSLTITNIFGDTMSLTAGNSVTLTGSSNLSTEITIQTPADATATVTFFT